MWCRALLGFYGITLYTDIDRGAIAGKATKALALPRFWVTVNPFSTRGADYAHVSTMGLAWLKFAVAPLTLLARKVGYPINSATDYHVVFITPNKSKCEEN